MKNLILSIVMIVMLSVSLPGIILATPKPNHYEMRIIRADILNSFRELTNMWKEELYFDMYDLGQEKSNKLLSKVEFAQRMVDLQWKPSISPEVIEDLRIDYRSFGEIHSIIEFENKVNPTRRIKKQMIFLMVLENKVWKFDLTQLIRIPFGGKLYEPPPPKKVEPPLTLDSTDDTTQDVEEDEDSKDKKEDTEENKE